MKKFLKMGLVYFDDEKAGYAQATLDVWTGGLEG